MTRAGTRTRPQQSPGPTARRAGPGPPGPCREAAGTRGEGQGLWVAARGGRLHPGVRRRSLGLCVAGAPLACCWTDRLGVTLPHPPAFRPQTGGGVDGHPEPLTLLLCLGPAPRCSGCPRRPHASSPELLPKFRAGRRCGVARGSLRVSSPSGHLPGCFALCSHGELCPWYSFLSPAAVVYVTSHHRVGTEGRAWGQLARRERSSWAPRGPPSLRRGRR